MNNIYILIFISIGIIYLFQISNKKIENFREDTKLNKIKNFFNNSKIIIFVVCMILIVQKIELNKIKVDNIVPEIYLEKMEN